MPRFALFRNGLWFGYATSLREAETCIQRDKPNRKPQTKTCYGIRSQTTRFKRRLWR